MNRGTWQRWGLTLGLVVLAIPSALASPLQRRIAAEPNHSIDIPLVAESFSLAQEEERKAEADRLLSEGVQFFQAGQYQAALDNLQQALVIYRELGNRLEEGVTLLGLGRVYDSIGQYPQAIEFYEQALVICREVGVREAFPQGSRSVEGTTLINLGLVYRNLGQYPQAIEFNEQALAIQREVGNRPGEGMTLSSLGTVYDSLGQYPQEIEFNEQALAIQREVGDRSGEGTTLSNLGSVYLNLGQYPKAIEFYEPALAIIREVENRAMEGTTLNNLGWVYDSLGQYPEAEQYLFDAIVVYESLRPTELSDADKISIFETQSVTYRSLQQVLIAQNKIETALEISERGRARAFVELMARRQQGDSDAEFVPPPPPTLADIQQVARDQNATLVEYSINDSLLYIWVIRPTGEIDFRQIDISATTPGFSLDDLMEQTHYALGVRGLGLVPRDAREIVPVEGNLASRSTSLQTLHQLLIKPIAALLPQTPAERVIFVPHSQLFLVPFPALQDANGTQLIDKHTILTAPAIQVLQLAQREKGAGEAGGAGGAGGAREEVLVVGNPVMPSISVNPGDPPMPLSSLPGAETEAKAIARLLGTEPLLGSAATEPVVVERMKTARIVHLATHGILDDEGGLGSSIALTPGNASRGLAPNILDSNDGFLTAQEILGLNLNADLMVLSACDTGRGKVTGDGVVGLSRSLVTAGVSSLVVSLWQVPDAATTMLMTRFYENWQQGLDKATALRNAMLETRATYPDPADWAAFTLIGESP